MRIVRYAHAAGARMGLVVDDIVIDLHDFVVDAGIEVPAEVVTAIMSAPIGDALARMTSAQRDRYRVKDAELLAPIDRPGKILALAANYSAHANEVGETPRDKSNSVPHVFPKMPSTLAGPQDPILIPEVSDMVDYEVELGVVIGGVVDRVSPSEALSHVAGYVLFNDVSARRMTFRERSKVPDEDGFWDFLYGKWCNGFAIVGPWIASVQQIPDPTDLRMNLSVNGMTRQSARVGEYTFTIAEAISFMSRICRLEPGDVIAMGTPAGIGEMGLGCLNPGDVVEASIDGLGVQRNLVERAPSATGGAR